MLDLRKSIILTRALWPPFPRPYWPKCACSEGCDTDGSRRLRCRACRQSAERPLPTKLRVGEEACAAIDRAERLLAQLAILGFRPALDSQGALLFCDMTGQQRDFARMCPPSHDFAVMGVALDVDPDFVGPLPVVALKKPRLKLYRPFALPARAEPAPVPEADAVVERFWHVCSTCGLAGPVDAPDLTYCRLHGEYREPEDSRDDLTAIERILGRRVLGTGKTECGIDHELAEQATLEAADNAKGP